MVLSEHRGPLLTQASPSGAGALAAHAALPAHDLGTRLQFQRLALPLAQTAAQRDGALGMDELHGAVRAQRHRHAVRSETPALALAFHAPAEEDALGFALAPLGP